MRPRTLPLVVLVAAIVALVGTAAWAVERSDGGWAMHRFGNEMMGYAPWGDGQPVRSLADARRQADRFANRLDLQVGEVMRFSNHYYAELEENGRPATEVLVDPESGSVQLEVGPAMMWNTRFGMKSNLRTRKAGNMMGRSTDDTMGGGMMGSPGMGIMGAGYADPTWTPGTTQTDVAPAKARRLAQRWLDGQATKLTAGKPEAFPGYYTLHVLRAGNVVGMLSVNAVTGAPWYHWWHGRFVAMSA